VTQQLVRLEKELAAADQAPRWIELTARIAIVLARLSRFDEARQRISALRSRSTGAGIGGSHLWIMLAEAIADWYDSLSPQALDRVTRVQVLSGAMRYDHVTAIACAWKAHIQFETSDFDGMFRSLALAHRAADAANGDANTRVAIVVCNALALCGNGEQAQRWFMRGREFALADGDLSSIEALQYNRSVLALAGLRAQACFEPLDLQRLKQVRRELESTRNLQSITDNRTLVNHLRLAEARLMLLEKNYADALRMLHDIRGQSPFASYHFSPVAINLEMAFCHWHLGEADRSFALLEGMDFHSLTELDIDDQLVAASYWRALTRFDDRFGSTMAAEQRFEELVHAYVKSRERLAEGLRQLDFVRDAG
jgi:hypothetical protein